MHEPLEIGCQERNNEFGFTSILFEDTHMLSGRETEIWETQDQGEGSSPHPSFQEAMDILLKVI